MRHKSKREKINWFVGGGFGVWMILALFFFIFAIFAPDYIHGAFRTAGGFFCLVLAAIAEARTTILNAIIGQKEKDNNGS